MNTMAITAGRFLPKGAVIRGRAEDMTSEQVRGYLWKGDRPRKSAMLYTVDGVRYVVTNHRTWLNEEGVDLGDDLAFLAQFAPRVSGVEQVTRDYEG